MSWESWFKVALPALPSLYTIFGVWLYWGESPAPLLAPALAFWGVVVVYYLFGRAYAPKTYSPFWLAICTVLLWFVSVLTSHQLAVSMTSNKLGGITDLVRKRDFWYAYFCGLTSADLGLWQFLRHEPEIVAYDRTHGGGPENV